MVASGLAAGCIRAPPSLRDTLQAWALVSAAWVSRVLGLLLLLGVFGAGFSFTLALLFLCTSCGGSGAAGWPGGAAMQAGAGAAVLVAFGVGVSEAVGVAIAVQTLGMLVGGSIFLVAAAWRAGLRLAPRYRSVRVRALSAEDRRGSAGVSRAPASRAGRKPRVAKFSHPPSRAAQMYRISSIGKRFAQPTSQDDAGTTSRPH